MSTEEVDPGRRMLSDDERVAGRYRVVRRVGASGGREVYEASQVEGGGPVVLEVVDAASERELRLLRRVTHRNVARVLEVGGHACGDGAARVFVARELLRGETLAVRLRRSRMSTADALPIVRQIAGALEAARAAGIAHRAPTSDDVFLEEDATGTRVVVTGLGVAPATPTTDVQALGALMFELVTGTRPARTATTPEPRAIVPDLDERWEDTILACLDADPSRRPRDAAAAILSLAVPPRPRRRVRETLLLAALGCGVALVLADLGAPAGRRGGGTPRREIVVTGFEQVAAGTSAAELGPDTPTARLGSTLTAMLATELGADLRRPDAERTELVVGGAYALVGSGELRVTVDLRDAAGGDIVASFTESGDPDDVRAIVTRLGVRIRVRLAVER